MANRAVVQARSAVDDTPKTLIVFRRGGKVHINTTELTGREALKMAWALVDMGAAAVLHELEQAKIPEGLR